MWILICQVRDAYMLDNLFFSYVVLELGRGQGHE